ncbi:MAG: hypothetical protein ACFCVA_04465 [Gammaproteobacteria bacterium]
MKILGRCSSIASYFPYPSGICLNGHGYAKRQLAEAGIPFEALDNGLLSCADPRRLQPILDELTTPKIQALVDKWRARSPRSVYRPRP